MRSIKIALTFLAVLFFGAITIAGDDMPTPVIPDDPNYPAGEPQSENSVEYQGMRMAILASCRYSPNLTREHFLNLGFTSEEYIVLKSFSSTVTPEIRRKISSLSQAGLLSSIPGFASGTRTRDAERERQLGEQYAREQAGIDLLKNDSEKIALRAELQKTHNSLADLKIKIKSGKFENAFLVKTIEALMNSIVHSLN